MTDDEHLSNRQKAKVPRGRSFYCLCDMACVNAGEKCCVCGRRQENPRAKAKRESNRGR